MRPSSTSTLLLMLAPLLACGGTPRQPRADVTAHGPAAPASAPPSPLSPSPPPRPTETDAEARGCIVVQGDFAPHATTVEGVLGKSPSGATAPFVVRLRRPRCIVGLERASVVTEVYVASAAADLRPLVDARLRITGDAIAGTNDLGGPAVIVLAKDFARLEPDEAP